MSILTHTGNDKRLHVVFDDERTAPPESYTICLASMNRQVVAQPWESPAAAWRRVLDTVAAMRATLPLSSPQFHFATIFADVTPTDRLMQSVTKDRIADLSLTTDGWTVSSTSSRRLPSCSPFFWM